MSDDSDIKRCPSCTRRLRPDAVECQTCALVAEPGDNCSPLPDGVAPHRSNRILVLALVCGLSWCVGWPTLSCSGYFWNGTIQSIWLLLASGLPVVAVGQTCGTIALILAYRNWLGMKMGRVDRAGWWPTMGGGAIAAFFVLVHWSLIGFALHSLF